MNWISLLGLEAAFARWRASAAEGSVALEDRLALARLEWQDLRRNLLRLVLLVIVLAALLVLALLLLSVALLVQFWDSPQRILVAWLLAGGWLVACGVAFFAVTALAGRLANAFVFTRRELCQDWQFFQERPDQP
ncbi:hypothetical protein MASR1M59_18540 [Melaminivora sp.]